MPERISSFKDLRVYKLAFELQQDVVAASKHFPKEERYALTDQVRRAFRSIRANLSEAWDKGGAIPPISSGNLQIQTENA
jgi:hypothetical protein